MQLLHRSDREREALGNYAKQFFFFFPPEASRVWMGRAKQTPRALLTSASRVRDEGGETGIETSFDGRLVAIRGTLGDGNSPFNLNQVGSGTSRDCITGPRGSIQASESTTWCATLEAASAPNTESDASRWSRRSRGTAFRGGSWTSWACSEAHTFGTKTGNHEPPGRYCALSRTCATSRPR